MDFITLYPISINGEKGRIESTLTRLERQVAQPVLDFLWYSFLGLRRGSPEELSSV